jgi:hypothetical protein
MVDCGALNGVVVVSRPDEELKCWAPAKESSPLGISVQLDYPVTRHTY